jgi:hypothetical protein
MSALLRRQIAVFTRTESNKGVRSKCRTPTDPSCHVGIRVNSNLAVLCEGFADTVDGKGCVQLLRGQSRGLSISALGFRYQVGNKVMKLNQISSFAAIALLVTVGSAYADTITATTVGATPPVGFILMNLGTDATAGYVGGANSTITNPDSSFDNISSITFSGGSGSGSGIYSGSTSTSASPFNVGFECTSNCSNLNYLAAESATTVGGKSVAGSVTVNFSTEQQVLDLLWGTADIAANYNNITFYNCNTGFITCTQVANSAINGSDIGALDSQIANNSGDYNAWVTISNLGDSGSSFNQVVFSDGTDSPAFEFAIGMDPPASVPEPGSLAIFFAGLVGLVGFAAIRRRKMALAS